MNLLMARFGKPAALTQEAFSVAFGRRMKWRSAAGIVCVLVLSITTLFSAVHHHDGASDSQCAACAWHNHAKVDVPPASPQIQKPLRTSHKYETPPVLLISLSVADHFGRGPPSFS